ncbi:uncharacterized protein LOC141587614 [Silene latifolia]|uniref:uncharacterized protein LOC141587614 n=1 Tax=Silene latifolia TaxID=37657 RepID=UPI003D77053B
MRICNPSIRKSLLLPHCPLFPWFGYYTTYVLGYAPQTKGFKVIAISFKDNRGVMLPEKRLAVFTLNDQQWIVRDHDDFNFDCLSSMRLFGPYYLCDGAAHWLGRGPCEDSSNQDYKPTHLVSLDFDTESFTILELPHVLDNENIMSSTNLFLLGESLACFCISCKREYFCITCRCLRIWVLKQECGKREWTLWFSGPSSDDGFSLFHNNTRLTTKRVLYFDGGYLVYGRKSYNIATGQVQWLGKPMNPYLESETYSKSLEWYNESLLLCKGYGVEDTTDSPIHWGE